MYIGPVARTQNLCEINVLPEWQLEVRRETLKLLKWHYLPVFRQMNLSLHLN